MNLDHVSLAGMESIPVSKFKATCLAVLQRVKRTGRPVLITRFGRPVAGVIPPQRKVSNSHWLGGMAGRVEVVGDIVRPVMGAETWEAPGQ
jgi:prevent-host-death family protein